MTGHTAWSQAGNSGLSGRLCDVVVWSCSSRIAIIRHAPSQVPHELVYVKRCASS